MDAKGELELKVTGGQHLSSDLVGSHIQNYDFMMVLSHFKGHPRGGLGGALKNISIGFASSSGKNLIHSAGATDQFDNWPPAFRDIKSQEHLIFLECMAEAAKAVIDYFGSCERMLYLSVLNNLSVDCDCVSTPAPIEMRDIGIAAALAPVALDQACVDLVYQAPDGASLVERIESRRGTHILDHAQQLGLDHKNYQLVDLDR